RYEAALKSADQAKKMLAQARASVNRQDWEEVQQLSTAAAAIQRSLDAEQGSLSAAEAVYAAAPVALDPLSTGLTRFSQRWTDAASARAEVIAALAELVREDAANAALCTARQRALQAVDVRGAPATADAPKKATSGATVEVQALQALERGDAAAL